MNSRFWPISMLPVVLLSSCGGDTGEQGGVAGPCAIFFNDPVLMISGASDSSTQSPIPEVELSAITVDGRLLDARVLALSPSKNVRQTANGLACTLPCGFSVTEGKYTMTATAVGYRPASVQLEAKYGSVVKASGGCPTTVSGPTSVALALQPR